MHIYVGQEWISKQSHALSLWLSIDIPNKCCTAYASKTKQRQDVIDTFFSSFNLAVLLDGKLKFWIHYYERHAFRIIIIIASKWDYMFNDGLRAYYIKLKCK